MEGDSIQHDTDKHLKCDFDTTVCRRCRNDGAVCDRAHPKIKFRKNQKIDSKIRFSEDQPWINTDGDLKYVDETNLIVNMHGGTDVESDEEVDIADNSVVHNGNIFNTNKTNVKTVTSKFEADTAANDPNENGISSLTNGSGETSLRTPTIQQSSPDQISSNDRRVSTYDQYCISIEPLLEDPYYTLPVVSQENKRFKDKPQISPSRDRAVLLRYFVQELSLWFDICDSERHFGQVVPQRARSSQTLLNAICTASTRHIVRLQKYRNFEGVIEWNGVQLPHINQDTALEYHNECIRDLLRLSLDPEQIQNVDLLAASIILRTDEEMNAFQQEGKIDREVFLRVTGAFMDAQVPSTAAVPHSSPQAYNVSSTADAGLFGSLYDYTPSSESQIHISSTSPSYTADVSNSTSLVPVVQNFRAEGLRQACFWVALRQELHASFSSQRTFVFPMSKFDAFQGFSPATDAVWADRVVILHAAILEFCYNASTSTNETRQRWFELRKQADRIEAALPSSFQPIHSEEYDLESGRVIPELFYLDNTHAAAAAYIELNKILLVSFDPRRPKFGSGYLASQREIVAKSKSACLRLCGIALSNRQAPPIHLNAYSALALCGEYFEDKAQQEAILWFLRATEEEIAYPTSDLMTKLTECWSES